MNGVLYLGACLSDLKSECTVETFVALCVYKYCLVSNVSIIFVQCENNKKHIPICLKYLNYTRKEINELPWQVRCCKLPVFTSDNSVITGLCGVVRHLTKFRTTLPHSDEHPEGLLGFRSSCLQAPNEVSVWTKFCEIEIINTTKALLNDSQEMAALPPTIFKFEKHLNQPLRMHNVYKVAREIKTRIENERQDIPENIREAFDAFSINKPRRSNVKHRKWKSSGCNNLESPIELLSQLEHCFSEGPFMTLADIILYPCYSLIFHIINYTVVENILPKTTNWFKKIRECEYFEAINQMLGFSLENIASKSHKNNEEYKYIVPEIENVSLYKCDPKRHNPKKREFTKESDVDAALSFITESNMLFNTQENTFIDREKIVWSNIPPEANPYGGHLPDKRKDRKTQQLENLTQCVISFARDGQKIVDFCCGGGHLGILLAYLLPKCTIILLENKEESLKRASSRINNLGLKNIYLFQCNIDYFIGEFDIGVALHACGVATDLVLQKCILQKASFVVCPCCYGSLHSTERLEYPRSKMFSSVPMDKYLCISHAADQTHANHPLEAQGTQCMTIIDSDRAHNALQNGYNVCLTRILPLSCTPKNMLLVGEYR